MRVQHCIFQPNRSLTMPLRTRYKQHIINDKIPDGTSTTVYRCGPLIDLCRGPHVPNTGRIKAFEIMKNSASYFLGDAKNDSLQRIYGVSFPDKKVSQHSQVTLRDSGLSANAMKAQAMQFAVTTRVRY